MEINADFKKPAKVQTETLEWVPSPMAGVTRRMLDRVGGEVARATSIVRYAKGSAFAEHTHSGGEEFIVLEGVFQDEHGDYPAGTYVRNPVGTHHIPRSDPGCTIFVKLWQFDPEDQEQSAVDMNVAELTPDPDLEGVRRNVLASRDYEHVALEQWKPETHVALTDKGGIEVLVIGGVVKSGPETLSANDWLRLPEGEKMTLVAGHEGARIWMKSGHLPYAKAPEV